MIFSERRAWNNSGLLHSSTAINALRRQRLQEHPVRNSLALRLLGVRQLAVGTFASLRARNALQAVIWTLGVGITLNFVILVVQFLIGLPVVSLFFSPTIQVIVTEDWGQRGVYFRPGFTTGVMAAVAYLVVDIHLLFWMASEFDFWVGRSPDGRPADLGVGEPGKTGR